MAEDRTEDLPPRESIDSLLQPPDAPLARPRSLGDWARFPFLAAVRGYQLLLRPLVPSSCRHVPSCSRYAAEAIQVHGILRGCGLAALRILRCHPWGTSGFDPVPERKPGADASDA